MTTQPTTTITATELKHKSGELLRRVAEQRERFLIKRDGYSVAVLLSVEEYLSLATKEEESR